MGETEFITCDLKSIKKNLTTTSEHIHKNIWKSLHLGSRIIAVGLVQGLSLITAESAIPNDVTTTTVNPILSNATLLRMRIAVQMFPLFC